MPPSQSLHANLHGNQAKPGARVLPVKQPLQVKTEGATSDGDVGKESDLTVCCKGIQRSLTGERTTQSNRAHPPVGMLVARCCERDSAQLLGGRFGDIYQHMHMLLGLEIPLLDI